MRKIIAIEGSDGVGKETQTKILADRLEAEGHKVIRLSFPNYASPSSLMARAFLNKELGDLDSVPPKLKTAIFAIDRGLTMRDYLDQDVIILCDRYTSSAIYDSTHLVGKAAVKNFQRVIENERDSFLVPCPDVILLFNIDQGHQDIIIKERHQDSDDGDIYESNRDALLKVNRVINTVCSRCNDVDITKVRPIDCSDNGRRLAIEEVHENIYKIIKTEVL